MAVVVYYIKTAMHTGSLVPGCNRACSCLLAILSALSCVAMTFLVSLQYSLLLCLQGKADNPKINAIVVYKGKEDGGWQRFTMCGE